MSRFCGGRGDWSLDQNNHVMRVNHVPMMRPNHVMRPPAGALADIDAVVASSSFATRSGRFCKSKLINFVGNRPRPAGTTRTSTDGFC